MEAFDLVEDGGVRDVIVATINSSRGDNADRRLVIEHGTDLYRACMGTEERAIFEH